MGRLDKNLDRRGRLKRKYQDKREAEVEDGRAGNNEKKDRELGSSASALHPCFLTPWEGPRMM